MKKLPQFDHKFHIRTGRGVRPFSSLALGLLFTIGLPVFVFIGVVYELVGTASPSNYFLTGLLLLPILFPFVERVITVRAEHNAFFEFASRDNPYWVVFAIGWLLLSGYFSLVAIFSWGMALYTSRLLLLFFEVQVAVNLLAMFFLLLSTLYITSGGRPFLHRQQALFMFTTVGILLAVLFWATRTQTIPNASYYTSGGADYADWQTAPILALALWSLFFLFDRTTGKKHPRQLLNTAVTALILGTAVGVSATFILGLFPATITRSLTPLLEIALEARIAVALLWGMLLIVIFLGGLRRVLLTARLMLLAMHETGFLPEKKSIIIAKQEIKDIPLLLIVLGMGLVLLLLPIDNLLALSGVSLFVPLLLIFLPDTFRAKPKLPAERLIVLPLHPLFPAFVSFAAIIILSLIPRGSWLLTIVWLGIGALLYFVYGRRRQILLHQQDVLVTPTTLQAEDSERPYTVLVPILDETSSYAAIQAGIQVAKLHRGRVLLLQILRAQDEHAPLTAKQQEARQILHQLETMITDLGDTAVPIIPFVRIDDQIVHGVYDTGWEEKVDFILIGAEHIQENRATLEIIERIIRHVPAEVALIKGEFPTEIKSVLVPLQGSTHITAALELGQALVRGTQGKVVALYQTVDTLSKEKEQEAQQYIAERLEKLQNQQFIEPKIIQTSQFEANILQEAEAVDLLLFGLATEGYFQQTVLDGRPLEVASARHAPTLLIKQKESSLRHAANRSISLLLDWIPSTTIKERAQVTLQMRRDARAGTDFYILILLSASIAFFGLLLNSSAVIIGAMLVAPLMSPMMAMAHALILGNYKMLQEAANSTLRGILGAIAVATLLTIFLPPQPVTDEILARTQPNYLDLLVALVSGAAGAYAVSRKSLSAALPGVSIAAALVPPLCVVGYGLGTGRIDIASGALLLFLTNLASIVLASAVVFLLMGYHPRRDQQYGVVRRNLARVVIALLIISIPLLLTSGASAKRADNELTIETMIYEMIPPTMGEVRDIVIESPRFGETVVTFTLYAYRAYDPQEMAALQEQLVAEVGEPIVLRVTTLSATLLIVDETGIPTATPTPTLTVTPTLTATMTVRPRLTVTAILSQTAVPQPTLTFTPAFTATETAVPQATLTMTPIFTETAVPDPTLTFTPPPLATETATITVTTTLTATVPLDPTVPSP